MQVITTPSVDSFLQYQHSLEDTEFYRGISNDTKHRLIPSAGRYGIETNKAQLQFEKGLLSDFKRTAPLLAGQHPRTDFEWMILAQHHGLPTRLMDWSFNPLVALYFSATMAPSADGAVYVSAPSVLISSDIIDKWPDPFKATAPMHVIPPQKHTRYRNQNGVFTLHPEPRDEDFSQVHRKFLIPAASKPRIATTLRKVGISEAFLFSSLDGLSRDIMAAWRSKFGHQFREDEGDGNGAA